MPLQMRLQQDPHCIELWLRSVVVAALAKRTEDRHDLEGVPDIWGFFGGA